METGSRVVVARVWGVGPGRGAGVTANGWV